jgi:hypothetical protein
MANHSLVCSFFRPVNSELHLLPCSNVRGLQQLLRETVRLAVKSRPSHVLSCRGPCKKQAQAEKATTNRIEFDLISIISPAQRL